jgi:hypothetical protein
MAIIGYRVGLQGLSPRELDMAFSQSFRENLTSFRPTAGEIRANLREARMELRAVKIRALPEADLSPEEAKQLLAEVRERLTGFPASDIDIAKRAIAKAREELKALWEKPTSGYVLELSEEEFVTKTEMLKERAIAWGRRERV